MSGKYFIDTNIIVYGHDDAYPEKKEKAQELIFTGLREARAVISAQVLSEFFVTITKRVEMPYSVPAARHELMLLSHLEIVELDHDLVIRATRLHETLQVNYWAGLVLAAAERGIATFSTPKTCPTIKIMPESAALIRFYRENYK